MVAIMWSSSSKPLQYTRDWEGHNSRQNPCSIQISCTTVSPRWAPFPVFPLFFFPCSMATNWPWHRQMWVLEEGEFGSLHQCVRHYQSQTGPQWPWQQEGSWHSTVIPASLIMDQVDAWSGPRCSRAHNIWGFPAEVQTKLGERVTLNNTLS